MFPCQCRINPASETDRTSWLVYRSTLDKLPLSLPMTFRKSNESSSLSTILSKEAASSGLRTCDRDHERGLCRSAKPDPSKLRTQLRVLAQWKYALSSDVKQILLGRKGRHALQ